MTAQNRAVLKAYFETADVATTQSFIDLVDSIPNLADTTAQVFNSDFVVPNLIANTVSAATIGVAGLLRTSGASFGGRVRVGVSAAASASDSRGDMLVAQESTVAGATAQIAFLSASNIASFKAKVLVGGSAGAGGLTILIGQAGNASFFGTITVSATGIYEFTDVCASRLTNFSGAVQMAPPGASANTNIIGVISYYQRA